MREEHYTLYQSIVSELYSTKMIAFMFDRLVDWFECTKLAIYVLTLSHKLDTLPRLLTFYITTELLYIRLIRAYHIYFGKT